MERTLSAVQQIDAASFTVVISQTRRSWTI
jgi:hypothetical protein